MLNLFRKTTKFLPLPFKKSLLPLAYSFSSSKGVNKGECMITYKIDPYRSVIIDAESLNDDPVAFEHDLIESLDSFKRSKLRGVWLRLELSKSTLIPVALKHGFTFHHAKADYVLLSRWLPTEEINKLPHYASHFIGVGGIVINDETDEILVIKEKISFVGDRWKVPGGLVDPGEHISQAVEREVFEETGIVAKFQSVLAFREKLNYRWGQPDIYFATLLKPETYEIKIDPVEIKESKWMKLEEYLKLETMIKTQALIADIIRLADVKATEKIKQLNEESLLRLAGFGADHYGLEAEGLEPTKNATYYSNLVRKTRETK